MRGRRSCRGVATSGYSFVACWYEKEGRRRRLIYCAWFDCGGLEGGDVGDFMLTGFVTGGQFDAISMPLSELDDFRMIGYVRPRTASGTSHTKDPIRKLIGAVWPSFIPLRVSLDFKELSLVFRGCAHSRGIQLLSRYTGLYQLNIPIKIPP
jgi:hypothetical protein